MICEIHDLKKIAICYQCKCLLCVQCIFELHKTHLHQIVLIKTLVILANSMTEFLTHDHPELIQYDLQRHYQYLEQKQEYLEMLEILKKSEDFYQLEWLIKVLEKYILHQWLSLINSNNKLAKQKKINQKEELAYNLLKQDDAKYIYFKQYDLYYLLKHYGNNQEAFQIQKLTLMRLMKENCFFDIKDDQIQNDKQYNKIEQDEHFIISQGRNYYLIREYKACIEFMNNYQYIDEARIYIALSNFQLKNYDEAYQQLEEFKLKAKNIDLIELFQGIDQLNSRGLILDLKDIYQIPFFTSLSKIKKLQLRYQFLYQKYPCKIFFNLFCEVFVDYHKVIIYLKQKKMKKYKFCVIKQSKLIHKIIMLGFIIQFKSIQIFELQEISHKLILIEPLNIIGYIFQGACLIFQEKFQELDVFCGALKMKFQKSNLLDLLECVNLMLKKKYNKALQLYNASLMPTLNDYSIFKLEILLKLKNLPLIYDWIFQYFENGNCDYGLLHLICFEINKICFHEEAINLLEGYVDLDKKEGKIFYHILLGKLLVDQGIKFNDLEIIQQGLDELIILQFRFMENKIRLVKRMKFFKNQSSHYLNSIYFAINTLQSHQDLIHSTLLITKQNLTYFRINNFMQSNFQLSILNQYIHSQQFIQKIMRNWQS